MRANGIRYAAYTVGAVFLLKIVMSIFLYNRLIDEEHFLHISHGQLDIELQKRKNVYKKAAYAVDTYIETEKRLFNLLIELNGAIRTGTGIAEAKDKQDEAAMLLTKLRALAEASPNLKAKGPYVYFMETIWRAEQGVVAARMHYNDAVAEYNTFLRIFPYNIAALMHGFKKVQFNSADKGADVAPIVESIDFTHAYTNEKGAR
ncbi:MAG: LemA family protein [Candidatus Magnetominusculus sp. LBB02]|nr:LemA family protein [Candidatus Magnetominusculus sp. LBB02]